jgi:hypothetical protein
MRKALTAIAGTVAVMAALTYLGNTVFPNLLEKTWGKYSPYLTFRDSLLASLTALTWVGIFTLLYLVAKHSTTPATTPPEKEWATQPGRTVKAVDVTQYAYFTGSAADRGYGKAKTVDEVLADVIERGLRSGDVSVTLTINLSNEGEYEILGRKWRGSAAVSVNAAPPKAEKAGEPPEGEAGKAGNAEPLV